MPRLLSSSEFRRRRDPDAEARAGRERLRPTAGTGAPAATSGVPGTLRHLEIRPSRRLGQNFLLDPRVAERIAALVEDPREPVVEIGPGLGALTERLASSGRRVIAVEVDPRLAEHVERLLGKESATRVVRGDILEQRLDALLPGSAPVTVVANLPYSITTPAIEWILRQGARVRRALLMVQREVAERMTAHPGSKAFGSLAVFLALHAEVKPLFRVSPGAFHPRPDIDSVVVELVPGPYPGTSAEERQEVERIARAATTARRKTIGNALARGLDVQPEAARARLIEAGIDPTRRGETLSVEEWIALARVWGRAET